MHGNHEGGAKRILNSAIGTADHCYRRVAFELRIRFETAIVSDHTSRYFKIFELHLNIFPISETTVTEPQLYYIQTVDCSHLNRLLFGLDKGATAKFLELSGALTSNGKPYKKPEMLSIPSEPFLISQTKTQSNKHLHQ